jgi:iron complex outermembrane receptor protein
VLFSGLRFDNQQCQDEHGLGLSQIGIKKVEVIKGPASLLYGSDALGGVINIVEEQPVKGEKSLDAGTQLFSNTRGTLTDIGYKNYTGATWWRIRGGMESHADYSDGNNSRVLNSRNNGYYLKTGMGFTRKNWTQENSYNFSLNQYGFIMEDLNSFFTPDARWSRKMDGPHHIVLLNLFNSQNTFLLKSSILKLNVGAQSNVRMEDEGGGQISLNMHLFSALQNLRWEKEINKNTALVINQQYTFEQNTNYGGRIIIPDASMMEQNVSGYLKWNLGKFIIEAGAGITNKYIKTVATRSLNTPGEIIQPFSRDNTTSNGMAGAVCNPNDWLTLKFNTSTGFRAANLAELSSNGLHEGVYRYEIGDPTLKTEQNINSDVTVEGNLDQLFFSASAYYNRFFNYIYLAPTSDKFYGFPVFRYRQQDAYLVGGEYFMTVKPAALRNLQWKEGLTIIQGVLNSGGYLPFIPAYRLNSALRFEKTLQGKISSFFIEPELVYVFNQDRPAQFETPTPAYLLLNFASGMNIKGTSGNWRIGLNCTNVTNNAYYDHLSRLKYYGLNNTGINFVLSARKEIKWKTGNATR